MSDDALRDRRQGDVRLAVLESNFLNHVTECTKAHGVVDTRLGRIEIGIVAMLVALLGIGATIIAYLSKITLHLPS